jgi:hypothetical protein
MTFHGTLPLRIRRFLRGAMASMSSLSVPPVP